MTQSQILSNHAAHGQDNPVHPFEFKHIQHGDHVVGEPVQGIRRRRCFALAVASGIVPQHAESFAQNRYLRFPHDATTGERMAQTHRSRLLPARELAAEVMIVGSNAHALRK
jgi:hypothetical protein